MTNHTQLYDCLWHADEIRTWAMNLSCKRANISLAHWTTQNCPYLTHMRSAYKTLYTKMIKQKGTLTRERAKTLWFYEGSNSRLM